MAAASAVALVAVLAAEATLSVASEIVLLRSSGNPMAETAGDVLAWLDALGSAVRSLGSENAEPGVELLEGCWATIASRSAPGKVKPLLLLADVLELDAIASAPAGFEVDGTVIGGIAVGRGVVVCAEAWAEAVGVDAGG